MEVLAISITSKYRFLFSVAVSFGGEIFSAGVLNVTRPLNVNSVGLYHLVLMVVVQHYSKDI